MCKLFYLLICMQVIFFDGHKCEDVSFNTVSTTQSSKDKANILKEQLAVTNRELSILKNNVQNLREELHKLKNFTHETSSQNMKYPRNCKEVLDRNNTVSGVYRIKPRFSSESFLVLCDMKTKSGGWTYFLNRFDGSQDFFLNWTDYKMGFGNLAKEHWLGLEKLYLLTAYEPNELLVELEDWDSKEVYASYGSFMIGPENEGYAIKLLSSYSGTAGDSLGPHAGNRFSTKDNDQDRSNNTSCASYYKGAWWYGRCSSCDLSGKYKKELVDSSYYSIMYWDKFSGNKYGLKKARMMIRPRDNNSSPLLPHKTI